MNGKTAPVLNFNSGKIAMSLLLDLLNGYEIMVMLNIGEVMSQIMKSGTYTIRNQELESILQPPNFSNFTNSHQSSKQDLK